MAPANRCRPLALSPTIKITDGTSKGRDILIKSEARNFLALVIVESQFPVLQQSDLASQFYVASVRPR